MKRKRWVVKAGSNLIVSGGPLLIRSWMQQVESLRRDFSIEVIWVTSGAIATATDKIRKLKLEKRINKLNGLSDKQALSAIGQPLIMDLYNLGLQNYSLMGSQILLTYDDFVQKERKKNFQNTVEKLLSIGVVPILNENDAVSTEEIRFGDNDSLSAKVAIATHADRLVILTDVEGLYDSDPNINPNAKLISKVSKIDISILNLAGKKSSSMRGTGGMYSKVLAAQEALKKGIASQLVRGDRMQVLLEIAKGSKIGTYFGNKK